MAEEEVLRRIEERLTRLEGALSQGAGAPAAPQRVAAPGGVVVDPPPWGGGYPPWYPRRPFPIANPIPNPVVDPAPYGGGVINQPPVVTAPIGTVADPAPYGGGVINQPPVVTAPIGPVGDPPPLDLSRFTLAQLESSLHTIAAERARLDATEKMINERIAALKKEG